MGLAVTEAAPSSGPKRWWLRRGLRTRLAAAGGLAVLIVGSVSIAATTWIQARDMQTTATRRAAALLDTLAVPCAQAISLWEIEQLDGFLSELTHKTTHELGLLWIVMTDNRGRAVVSSDVWESGRLTRADASHTAAPQAATRQSLLVAAATADHASWWRIRDARGHPQLVVSMPAVAGLRWGTLVAGFDERPVERAITSQSATAVLVGVLLMLGLMAALYTGIARFVLRPIDVLDRAARAIAGGDLGVRVDVQTHDELGHLARTFNGMTEELEANRADLEAKVATRTLEVEEKNRQLSDVNERLEEAVAGLARLARTDEATGLLNRRAFREQLDAEMRRSERSRAPLAIALIDLDHFKSINDRFGHPAGDRVLADVGRLITDGLRASDHKARIGGDEFAVLLVDTTTPQALAAIGKLVDRVRTHRFRDDQDRDLPQLTFSVGLAARQDDLSSPDTLVLRADRALYEAKGTGRARVVLWRPELGVDGVREG